MAIVIAVIGFVTAALLTVSLGLFLNAWAATVLWAWFVVPLVPFLPQLSYAGALGLMLAAGLFFPHIDVHCEDKRKSTEKAASLVGTLLRPVVFVCIGWLVKYFGGL